MAISDSPRSIAAKSSMKLINNTGLWGREYLLIFSILMLSFVNGLIYFSIIPPWQHYDEPAQYEYAWLIANRPGLPERGDYDQFVRREIAASMVEHDFFRGLDIFPNLVGSQPIWIGISQIGELPFYYWIASLPLRLTKYLDVVLQLKSVRLVSLFMYIITILAGYGIAREVTGKNHPLRWLLPASIALIPSFVDIMTAVNDDVGAAAFFSIFLWAGVRLIQKGFGWLRFLVLLFFAVLCFWTKNTVVIAIILIFIPVLFSLFRDSKRKYAWIAVIGGTTVLIFSALTWGDAAVWYKSSTSSVSTHFESLQSPLGSSAIRISIPAREAPPSLLQIIPKQRAQEIRDQPVSLGAWIWSSRPAKVRTPIIINGDQIIFDEVDVDQEPRFFLITSVLEPSNLPLIVNLSPVKRRVDQGFTTYYDGVVLTGGNHPKGEIPVFNDISGEEGLWNGHQFRNAIRNSSGEKTWPIARRWVDILVSKYFPGRPSLVIASLLDLSNFRTYYTVTLKTLFESFWARFGWGNITISGFHPYLILGIFTLIGMLGAIRFFLKNHGRLSWELILFLGLPVVMIWGSTLVRGINSYMGNHFLVPVSRYAYPVIIPTMLLIDIGWLEIGKIGKDSIKIPSKVIYALLICFLVGLNILSIYSIIHYFQV